MPKLTEYPAWSNTVLSENILREYVHIVESQSPVPLIICHKRGQRRLFPTKHRIKSRAYMTNPAWLWR